MLTFELGRVLSETCGKTHRFRSSMGRAFAAYVPTTVLCPLGQHASSRKKQKRQNDTHADTHTDTQTYAGACELL